jgi:hypothetical protein
VGAGNEIATELVLEKRTHVRVDDNARIVLEKHLERSMKSCNTDRVRLSDGYQKQSWEIRLLRGRRTRRADVRLASARHIGALSCSAMGRQKL